MCAAATGWPGAGGSALKSEHCRQQSNGEGRAVRAGATTVDNPSHGSRVLIRVVSWLRESPVSPPHQQPATRLAADSPSAKARQVHIVNRVSQQQSRPPPCVRSSASTSARPVSRADWWSVQTVRMSKSIASNCGVPSGFTHSQAAGQTVCGSNSKVQYHTAQAVMSRHLPARHNRIVCKCCERLICWSAEA